MRTSFITKLFLAITFICLSAGNTAYSQQRENNIIERIEAETDGAVTFDIPDDIMRLIFAKPKAQPRQDNRPGIHKVMGYRIQIFSDGRTPQTLQARASARGNAVSARFPKYRGQVYVFSKSPNWYCRIGNFSSQSAANAALAELKRAFPAFAAEMRVVKSPIVVIK